MITVVTPVFNEENSLEELFSRLDKAFKGINQDFNVLFVDNGSKDGSLKTIKKIKEKNNNVKYISLTKNFGHQGGIWAGIYHVEGSCIIMDSDLQHPPETIPGLVEKWKNGAKVVNTKKISDDDNRLWKKLFSKFFYNVANYFTKLELSSGQSDFCLIDKDVVKLMKELPERKIFIRGLINSLGFESSTINYNCARRKNDKSKFSIFEYLNLAFDGIISFSAIPATIFFWFGILIALGCIIYSIYLFLLYLFFSGDSLPPGWTTIVLAIFFLSAVQLIGLGVIGKYNSITLENIKKKPEFIVKEKSL